MIDINHSVLPKQNPYRVSIDKTPVSDIGLKSRHLMWTNDMQVVWATAEPGTEVDWHTHMPNHSYQIYVNLEGRMRWRYKDNDGKEQTIEAQPGEVVYIPAGFQNKIEIPGDEHHTHVGVWPNKSIGRLGTLLNEEGDYNTRDREDEVGLWYDTIRDEVVTKVDDAVIE